jgi:hypothetical protein
MAEQSNWRICANCNALFFSGADGVCVGGHAHGFVDGREFALTNNVTPQSGQAGNWKACQRCQVLAMDTVPGSCAAGGQHDFTGSAQYVLSAGQPGPHDHDQSGWKPCRKCVGLILQEGSASGSCPGGGEHTCIGGFYNLTHGVFTMFNVPLTMKLNPAAVTARANLDAVVSQANLAAQGLDGITDPGTKAITRATTQLANVAGMHQSVDDVTNSAQNLVQQVTQHAAARRPRFSVKPTPSGMPRARRCSLGRRWDGCKTET